MNRKDTFHGITKKKLQFGMSDYVTNDLNQLLQMNQSNDHSFSFSLFVFNRSNWVIDFIPQNLYNFSLINYFKY